MMAGMGYYSIAIDNSVQGARVYGANVERIQA
jgi:hypothetical protein